MTDLPRAVRTHRGLLAGGLTAAAVAVALPQLAPDPPATASVVAAAHDLVPGAPLRPDDVQLLLMPRSVVPQGALTTTASAVGHAVASRVRRGEPLTDVRLLGAGLVADEGLVAAPVRLADAASATLLHAGDRVDVLATAAEAPVGAVASTLADDLRVLAVPGGDDGEGALVVLAAPPDVAARLAGAAVASRLSVTVLPT